MAELNAQNSGKSVELLEGKPVIVATGKQESWQQFKDILGEALYPAAVYDPESLAINFGKEGPPEYYQAEPAGPDAVKAVEFKLARHLHEIIQSQLTEYSEYLVVASDVSFMANNEHFHRLSRNPAEEQALNSPEAKRMLSERYQQPFVAEWQAAFGLAEKTQVSTGAVTVFAEYPALAVEDIEKYYDPNTNPGLRLIELGIDQGLTFYLSLSKDTDPIACDTPRLKKLVEQFIVKKVPTLEMVEELYKASAEQQPEQVGIFAVALRHFLETEEGQNTEDGIAL